MKKSTKVVLILVLVLSAVFVFSGCMFSGNSAYDIAVKNGFVGSEKDWLNSLQGSNGIDGENTSTITVEDLYHSYLQNVNPNASFEDFLIYYFSVSVDETLIASTKALKSVVGVSTEYGSGSGVVYKIDGEYMYIITNYHVLYSHDYGLAKFPRVFTHESYTEYLTVGGAFIEYHSATFVGGDANNDIAVLKTYIKGTLNNLVEVEIANSNNIEVGQTAIVVGNALGDGISVTKGIVSVKLEEIALKHITNANMTMFINVIRVDAAINPGNSGGGLFDRFGKLIGIVNAKTVAEDVDNMGYAIPINTAVEIADKVIG